MKTTDQTVNPVLTAVEQNKDIQKALKKLNYYGSADFVRDAERYIKAIKDGRMMCKIDKISASGMSRTLKFFEMNGKEGERYSILNFFTFFTALGYSATKDRDTFRINGCGMDMVFHTNYTNIHVLHRLGFLDKKECETLAQQTPTVI